MPDKWPGGDPGGHPAETSVYSLEEDRFCLRPACRGWPRMLGRLTTREGHIPKRSEPVSKRPNHKFKVLLPPSPTENETGSKVQTLRANTGPPQE